MDALHYQCVTRRNMFLLASGTIHTTRFHDVISWKRSFKRITTLAPTVSAPTCIVYDVSLLGQLHLPQLTGWDLITLTVNYPNVTFATPLLNNRKRPSWCLYPACVMILLRTGVRTKVCRLRWTSSGWKWRLIPIADQILIIHHIMVKVYKPAA